MNSIRKVLAVALQGLADTASQAAYEIEPKKRRKKSVSAEKTEPAWYRRIFQIPETE